MAGNPFEVRVPNALEALMAGDAGYKGMRGIMQEREQNAAAKEAQNALMNGGDVKSALARLIGARDFQAANALANFGNQSFNQNIQSEQLKLAQQAAQRREEPEDIRKLRAAGMDPSSPEGRKALFPRTDTPLSATDKKAVMAAEDDVPRLDATIANIERAKQLNPQVFSGFGASLRGSIGTGLPDKMVPDFIADPKGSEATAEWDQVMGQEAIKNMSETLKGASTDFEMKKFISIAADTSKPPKVREAAMDRFLNLAKQERELRVRRSNELRSGGYFKPGGGQNAPSANAGGDPLSAARDAIARGADRNAVIQRLQQNGINPAGL